jgi:hypothetical protein
MLTFAYFSGRNGIYLSLTKSLKQRNFVVEKFY